MASRDDMQARHAFGSEKNIAAALKAQKLDAYDILFLDEKKVGWIDEDGNPIIVEDAIEKITIGTKELDIIDKTINIPLGAGLKQSENVLIADDGTMSVGVVNFSNIVQTDNEIIVFDGGSSAE